MSSVHQKNIGKVVLLLNQSFNMSDDFYCRYYVGHKGQFGHEYCEFEIFGTGKLRYANNSNYKKDVMIRKEAKISKSVIAEFKKIIDDSLVTEQDDNLWPEPDRQGRQELEIKMGSKHISFTVIEKIFILFVVHPLINEQKKIKCAKIGSLINVQENEDPEVREGLRLFYYLTQDLKCLVFSLISLHFKIKPIP